MKSGFFVILGRPNVGKSSLMNAIIGVKASIISPKAQTTRAKITGILTTDDGFQLVFSDTPGIFKPKTKLDEFMEKSIKNACNGVDACLFVVDASKGISERERLLIESFSKQIPLYLIINKVDLVGFEGVYPILEQLKTQNIPFLDVIACSSKKKTNIDLILQRLKSHCNDQNQYYESDDFTDKTITFLVSEIIREKALYRLNQEIPHGIGVNILSFKEKEGIINIEADIVVEKSTHKRIVIGENGAMVKLIGSLARQDIEKLTNKQVFLSLFVKVRENWRNNQLIISDLGYKKD